MDGCSTQGTGVVSGLCRVKEEEGLPWWSGG